MDVLYLNFPIRSRYIITGNFNHGRTIPKLTNRTCCKGGGATVHDGCDDRINYDPSIKTQLMTNLASLESKTCFINVGHDNRRDDYQQESRKNSLIKKLIANVVKK